MSFLTAIQPAIPEERQIHLCWMVSNLCDFKCSYCAPSNHNGTVRGPNLEATYKFLDQFLEQTKKFNLVHVSFTGGEPTLWRPFKEVVQNLESRGVEIGLTTNGQRNINFWDGIAEKINWICLSFHTESADPDHFIKLISALETKTSVNVRVMMPPDATLWSRGYNLWKRLQQLDSSWGFFMEMVALEDEFGKPSMLRLYSTEQLAILKSERPRHSKVPQGVSPQNRKQVWTTREFYSDGTSQILNQPQLVLNNANKFRHWKCNAGTESIYIEGDGKIYKAGCKVDGVIGSIDQENFRLPVKQVICPKESCFCGTDIAIKKEFAEKKRWKFF